MIVTLKIIKNERNDVISKIRDIFPPKTSSELTFCGGTLFVDIKQNESRRGADWKKLAKITSIKEWLIPDGMPVPKESGIVDFKPKKLPQRLLANVASAAITQADIKPSELRIGLYPDKETEWFTEYAIEHAREVHLFTKENVEEKSEYYLKKYGAALVVSDDETALSSCSVIVAPAAEKLTCCTDGAFLFSPIKNACAMRIERAIVKADELFSELAELYGDMRLLSALYELDGRKVFSTVTPEQAGTNLGILSVGEIAAALRRGI